MSLLLVDTSVWVEYLRETGSDSCQEMGRPVDCPIAAIAQRHAATVVHRDAFLATACAVLGGRSGTCDDLLRRLHVLPTPRHSCRCRD